MILPMPPVASGGPATGILDAAMIAGMDDKQALQLLAQYVQDEFAAMTSYLWSLKIALERGRVTGYPYPFAGGVAPKISDGRITKYPAAFGGGIAYQKGSVNPPLTFTVAVPGATLTSPCTAQYDQALPVGIFTVATVTAAGQVTVMFVNPTVTDQVIPAGAARVDVFAAPAPVAPLTYTATVRWALQHCPVGVMYDTPLSAGLFVVGVVTAIDTVVVTFVNTSTVDQTIPPGNLRIDVTIN